MAKNRTILQVFVASPSDVTNERNILKSVIDEFNLAWSDQQQIQLEFIGWETHTHPDVGEDAQDAINQQIGDDYDIFLGIMWGRFGTPTGRSKSGTEEEFERAYSRLKNTQNNLKIMFYFKDTPISPSELDPTQFSKVIDFKRKLSSEFGVYSHSFVTNDEFRTKVFTHLSKIVQKWVPTTQSSILAKKLIGHQSQTDNPLANLLALTEENEDGLLDLIEITNEAMENTLGSIVNMANATEEINEKIDRRTQQLTELSAPRSAQNTKLVKRVINSAANDLEIYVNKIAIELPEFQKSHSDMMNSFSKITVIATTDLEADSAEIKQTIYSITEYKKNIKKAHVSLSGFQESIASQPRMTTVFNRAKSRAIAILDDLLAQFRSAEKQTEDIEKFLEQMI